MKEVQKVYAIYKHTNKTNGKTYIGVTTQKPERRWRGGKGYINQPNFFDDILKFGWSNFSHEILARTTKKEVADILESEFIKAYQTLGLSYNIREGGYEGYTQAESSRQKMSKSHSGSNNPMFGKFGADNPCSKKVVQLDKTDNHIITIFGSIIDAEKETGIPHQNISKACNGKLNSAGGYCWRYI